MILPSHALPTIYCWLDIPTLSNLKVDSNSQFYTLLVQLDSNNGSAIAFIDRPCQPIDRQSYAYSFLSTTCTDNIIVSCSDYAVATIKIYSPQLKALELNQFEGFTAITSVQYFDSQVSENVLRTLRTQQRLQVWFHTNTNQVGAYDLNSWQSMFRWNGSDENVTGSSLTMTQLFVDFAGNVLIGQSNMDASNYKLTILNSATTDASRRREVDDDQPMTLVAVRLDDWNNCQFTSAYRGKVYLLCQTSDDASNRHILVFDYLK